MADQQGLHKLVFKKDTKRISEMLQSGVLKERINSTDARGNSPLLLAGKLSKKDAEYLKVCRLLLFHGASTRVKDAEGWSIIEEAVSATNTRLLAIMFDYALEAKRQRWLERRE